MTFTKRILAAAMALAPLAAADTEFRVLTYNIHHAEGTDGKLDLDRIAEVILAERPDVVCLQEVDRGCARTEGVDMPAEFAKRLGMKAVFGPNLKHDGGDYGNATFSRFPVVESENFPLPDPEKGEPRGCLRVTLDIGGHHVDVLNTHFDLTPAARREQAARVVELLRDAPTILAGDLNETPAAPGVSQLMVPLRDSFGARKPDPEMEKLAASRIDYVLASGPLNVLSSRFVVTPAAQVASDHLPYWAHLSVGPAPETAKDRGVRDTVDTRIDGAILPGER
ncbi:MAG: endonuclease/exonuclease/phosphatase family protein [Candidatus Hydrogenedentes bacterium]|nr:endonuclease/exonuclease/phosphatase family protein [Candidatus Hydrogenedentota bacterium]